MKDWPLLAASGVAIVGVAVSFWILYDSTGDIGQIDFRIYQGSASGFAHGESLYHYRHPTFGLAATYPPFGPLLFVPTSLVNPRVAEVVWLVANMACIALILWLVCGHMMAIDGRLRRLVCLIGPSLAIPTALMWPDLQLGQVNLWIWLAIVADLILVRRGNRWSGVLIGLATAVKLVPGVFILFLVATRSWRPAVRASGAALGATLLAWMAAPSDSQLYWTTLVFDTSRIGALSDGRNNSLRFLVAQTSLEESTQVILWLLIVALVVPVGMRLAARSWQAGQDVHAMVVVGCVGALASPISWNHHLIFLLFGLMLLPLPERGPRSAQLAILLAGWVFLVDPVMFGVNRASSAVRCLTMMAVVAGFILRPSSWLTTGKTQDAAELGRLAA